MDWNDLEIVKQLFSLFQGTVEARGQVGVKLLILIHACISSLRYMYTKESLDFKGDQFSWISWLFQSHKYQNTTKSIIHIIFQYTETLSTELYLSETVKY